MCGIQGQRKAGEPDVHQTTHCFLARGGCGFAGVVARDVDAGEPLETADCPRVSSDAISAALCPMAETAKSSSALSSDRSDVSSEAAAPMDREGDASPARCARMTLGFEVGRRRWQLEWQLEYVCVGVGVDVYVYVWKRV